MVFFLPVAELPTTWVELGCLPVKTSNISPWLFVLQSMWFTSKNLQHLDDGFPVMELLATSTHLVCLSAQFTCLYGCLPVMSYGLKHL